MFGSRVEFGDARRTHIIKGDAELINRYRERFFKHREHSKPAVIREAAAKDRRQQPAAHPQHKAA